MTYGLFIPSLNARIPLPLIEIVFHATSVARIAVHIVSLLFSYSQQFKQIVHMKRREHRLKEFSISHNVHIRLLCNLSKFVPFAVFISQEHMVKPLAFVPDF